MLRETIDVLEERKKSQPSYKYEIIIVDDGSKDKTTQVALKYSKEISVENCRVLTLGKLSIWHVTGVMVVVIMGPSQKFIYLHKNVNQLSTNNLSCFS